MGIIPTLPQYGDDCLRCYPAGETPYLLKVFFSGIQIGLAWEEWMGQPPNGYFDVVQDEFVPCNYAGTFVGYPAIPLNFAATRTDLRLLVAEGVYAFAQTIGPVCADHLITEFDHDWGLPFWGGQAFITTAAKMAEAIESVTPMIDPDPRMECFPMEDEKIVLRYAGKRDATNIKIKLDTDLAYWYEHFG